MKDENRLLEILRETVIPGGIILNALRGTLDNSPKESDLPKDIADSMSTAHTIADDLVQEVALEILRGHGNAFRINAEEDTPRVKIFSGAKSSYCYHLDPLDGTLSYVEGKNGFAVGAAFSKDLEFQAAVIYFPAQNRVYLAQKRKGVRVETSFGAPLEFRRKNPPLQYYIERRAEDLRPTAESMHLEPLTAMGAHHAMISIAEGDASVLMYGRASPHDLGIPQVIVEEAGGVCTDFSGERIRYDKSFKRIPFFLSFSNESLKTQFFEYYLNV